MVCVKNIAFKTAIIAQLGISRELCYAQGRIICGPKNKGYKNVLDAQNRQFIESEIDSKNS